MALGRSDHPPRIEQGHRYERRASPHAHTNDQKRCLRHIEMVRLRFCSAPITSLRSAAEEFAQKIEKERVLDFHWSSPRKGGSRPARSGRTSPTRRGRNEDFHAWRKKAKRFLFLLELSEAKPGGRSRKDAQSRGRTAIHSGRRSRLRGDGRAISAPSQRRQLHSGPSLSPANQAAKTRRESLPHAQQIQLTQPDFSSCFKLNFSEDCIETRLDSNWPQFPS